MTEMTQVDARKIIMSSLINCIERTEAPYIVGQFNKEEKKILKEAKQWLLLELKDYIKKHPTKYVYPTKQ